MRVLDEVLQLALDRRAKREPEGQVTKVAGTHVAQVPKGDKYLLREWRGDVPYHKCLLREWRGDLPYRPLPHGR